MAIFTPGGRDRYRAALQESGIIQKVVQNYQTVSAVTEPSGETSFVVYRKR